MSLAAGDDCIGAAAGLHHHHHDLYGYRAASVLLSTSEPTVFALPRALSVEWVHLVRLQEGDAAEGKLGVSGASNEPVTLS